MDETMIFAAILAGGIGSRMNIADMPKQFLDLKGKPIVIHTLEKFLLSDKVDEIYIGVHPSWLLHMQDLIKEHVKVRQDHIHVVAGGADRNITIMNVIEKIEEQFGGNEEHYIITHDSVRPFVTSRIIEDNIAAVKRYRACDTATGAIDTIVTSLDGKTISEIPERRFLYQGQTPQSFHMSTLRKLYYDLTDEEKEVLTDACKIFVVRGVPVHIVEGEVSNLKITTVSDYKIAQAMVGGELID